MGRRLRRQSAAPTPDPVSPPDALAAHAAWLADLERGLADVRVAYGQRLDDLGRWMTSAVGAVTRATGAPVLGSPTLQHAYPQRASDPTDSLRRQLQVWSVSRWLELANPQVDVTVSVLLATRNRERYLRTAVASVLAQTHRDLQLVVIDDASTDGTADLLAEIHDARLTVVRLEEQRGASAARNAGLDAVTGSLVAYLDDDNRMAPQWLQAVAWAFDRWPEAQLLYGARLVEDESARHQQASGALPSMEFYDYDRRRLERSNYIDQNTLAHRAGLEGWRFDPSIVSNVEWEVMLRITEQHEPFPLPAVACAYGAYAPGRLGDVEQRMQETRDIRARIPLRRDLRLLAHAQMFPMLTETYIHEEMLALESHGASIAFSAEQSSVAPYAVDQPMFTDLAQAVAEHDPDLLVLHWVDHAEGALPQLEALGRPFAVRAHSFEFDVARFERLLAHPLCLGIWAFPHQAAQVPGVHDLVPLFVRHEELPTPVDRTVVLSVSAGLPKKDWSLLLEAFDLLPDLDRRIVVGLTNGWEQVVDVLRADAATRPHPPTISVNVPRRAVFEALSHASVCLYTLTDGPPVGMPMSIIEGMYAGACIVHADREDLRGVLGESWRPYRNAQDIADHVRAIMAGGPEIDAERARNQQYARDTFCDEKRGAVFYQQLRTALSEWLRTNG